MGAVGWSGVMEVCCVAGMGGGASRGAALCYVYDIGTC